MTACAAVAQPGFWLTGLTPGGTGGSVQGLSLNGGVAVGATANGAITPGFSWTAAGGRYDFGLEPGMPLHTQAHGVSSDGQTIIGRATGGKSYRRVGNGPLQYLGILAGENATHASEVSGDGSIVVGGCVHLVGTFLAGQAFRWTEATGIQGLGYARPNGFHSEALGISRDGFTIVGKSRSDGPIGPCEAFRWTESTGMQALPNLPGASIIESAGWAVNADGSVVVGYAHDPDDYMHAVRWTDGVIQDLTFGFADTNSLAFAVSDDGTVVGGSYQQGADLLGFVWTPGTGMLDVADFLTMHGLTLPAGYRVAEVFAVSGDGLTFGGLAWNLSTDQPEGFIATIPSPGVVAVLPVVPLLCSRRRRC